MSKILWLIVRKNEDIKLVFNVNFIEKFFLERIMRKKKVEFLPKTEKYLKGQVFDSVVVDEVSK